MSEKKIPIKYNTVQETLVIPLYARKLSTELFPNLYKDDFTLEIIDKIDYDFSKIEKNSDSFRHKFGALEVAMRQNDLAIEIHEYLDKYPKAALVNLGCGLDHTGENCDNGLCKIYNIDFKDVIDLRNQLSPESYRIKNIAADLNDFKWFDFIDASDGAIFFAAGVFYYFKREEIKSLFLSLEKTFPGAVLVFDTAGKRAVKMMAKTWLKEAGITNMDELFYVNDIQKDIIPWLKNSKVESKGYMMGYNDLTDKSISFLFRKFSKFCDNNFNMQIVKIEFE